MSKYLKLKLSKFIPFKTSYSYPSTSNEKKSIKAGAEASIKISFNVLVLQI